MQLINNVVTKKRQLSTETNQKLLVKRFDKFKILPKVEDAMYIPVLHSWPGSKDFCYKYKPLEAHPNLPRRKIERTNMLTIALTTLTNNMHAHGSDKKKLHSSDKLLCSTQVNFESQSYPHKATRGYFGTFNFLSFKLYACACIIFFFLYSFGTSWLLAFLGIIMWHLVSIILYLLGEKTE